MVMNKCWRPYLFWSCLVMGLGFLAESLIHY
jgi:hypothetical protein